MSSGVAGVVCAGGVVVFGVVCAGGGVVVFGVVVAGGATPPASVPPVPVPSGAAPSRGTVVGAACVVDGTDVVGSSGGRPLALRSSLLRSSMILLAATTKSCQIIAGKVPPVTGEPRNSVSIGFRVVG